MRSDQLIEDDLSGEEFAKTVKIRPPKIRIWSTIKKWLKARVEW